MLYLTVFTHNYLYYLCFVNFLIISLFVYNRGCYHRINKKNVTGYKTVPMSVLFLKNIDLVLIPILEKTLIASKVK